MLKRDCDVIHELMIKLKDTLRWVTIKRDHIILYGILSHTKQKKKIQISFLFCIHYWIKSQYFRFIK